MLRFRKTIDDAGTRVKLDGLAGAVKREAEGAEADPFDDAMIAAVAALAEALKAEAGVIEELQRGLARSARRADR